MTRLTTDVVIVGAGFAGLAAARVLARAGFSIIVLEARSRAGGRIETRVVEGVPIDLGGQWIGPAQKRINGLARELGVATVPTWDEGHHILSIRGHQRHYKGPVPRLQPAEAKLVDDSLARLDRMAATVSTEAPWTAPKALAWDGQTLSTWLVRAIPNARAREIVRLREASLVPPHTAQRLWCPRLPRRRVPEGPSWTRL